MLEAVRTAMELSAPDLGTAKAIAEIVSDQLELERQLSPRTILRDIALLNKCGARIALHRSTNEDPYRLETCNTYRLADPSWGLDPATEPTNFIPGLNAAVEICKSSGENATAEILAELREFLIALQAGRISKKG